jgi:copper homeostasis protein
MPVRPILEICVESAERAVAAERGGADRIELCSDLSSGGVTPHADLMRAARDAIRIPIHVLIRPRSGNFVYSDAEFETIKREISVAKELGMDGIVLGLLDENGRIEKKRTTLLIKIAEPLPVTFHRAFDSCSDLAAALDAVIETGASRILTSGGKASAAEGLGCLANLVAAAGTRIVIMPGGGIRINNIEHILQTTGAREVHSSLGMPEQKNQRLQASRKTGYDQTSIEFEARVRTLRSLIETS